MPGTRAARGFSLVEMLIVIALLGILMAISAPTMLRALRGYEFDNTSRQVASMLQRTQYEAVQRNRRLATVGTGAASTQLGMDLNDDSVLQTPPLGSEPYVQAPRNVWIIPFAPNWTAGCGVPLGYTNAAFPFNWRVAFTPRGTVTQETPPGSNNWVDAASVQLIPLIQIDPAEPGGMRWRVVAVSPAGRVRVFRFSRDSGNCGATGNYGWAF